MKPAERFIAYAMDFEKTYADDDWSRLEEYFEQDAVYEVLNTPFACKVEGRDAIFRAIKKSLDGFDRKLADRQIEVTRGPEINGNEIELDWTVTYSKAGVPDFPLVGSSFARLEGDRIAYMCDRYPDGLGESAEAWIRKHAPDLDPAYV